MTSLLRPLGRLLLPLSLVALAWLADHHAGGAWRDAPRLLPAARVVVAVVLLLAWRLRRGRVAWAVLALWIGAEASLRVPSADDPSFLALALGLGVVLPLHLAAAAWLGEWWVASRAGLARLAILGVEVGALVALGRGLFLEPVSRTLADLRARLGSLGSLVRAEALPVDLPTGSLLDPSLPLDELAVPFLRVASFALAGGLIFWALHRRRSPLEAGLLAACVAVAPAAFRPGHGAPGFVVLTFGVAVLVLGVALVENAVRLAFHDGLTGLPARRALEESLEQLGGRYAVAMVDLDRFKRLNDRYGHDVGDQVLRKTASRLARVRAGGRAFRYGGEEFTVLFPGRDAEAAEIAMDEVRRAIADEPFTVRSPGRPAKKGKGKRKRGQGGGVRDLKVTVSVGIAERGETRSTPAEVMEAADAELYKAKKAGRNRVKVAR